MHVQCVGGMFVEGEAEHCASCGIVDSLLMWLHFNLMRERERVCVCVCVCVCVRNTKSSAHIKYMIYNAHPEVSCKARHQESPKVVENRGCTAGTASFFQAVGCRTCLWISLLDIRRREKKNKTKTHQATQPGQPTNQPQIASLPFVVRNVKVCCEWLFLGSIANQIVAAGDSGVDHISRTFVFILLLFLYFWWQASHTCQGSVGSWYGRKDGLVCKYEQKQNLIQVGRGGGGGGTDLLL